MHGLTIDGPACVRARLLEASCAACQQACPAAAIDLAGRAPVVDALTCTLCGACPAACPEAVFSIPARIARVQGRSQFIDCRCQPSVSGADAPRCIHSIGLRDLAQMWLAGVRHLVVLADSCVTCDTAPMVWMEAMVAQFNQLAECRNLDRIKLNSASPAEVEHWQVTQEPVDRSRRAFLRRFRVAASAENTDEVGAQSPDALQRFLAQGAQHLPESMLYPFAPRIDADACVGCDSCVTICPHEALTLIKAQNGKSVYHSAAERCTGCLLCSDICDVDAIEVFGMSSRGADIPLSRFQCRACGVQSHTPHPQPPTDGLCRICQGTGHYNKLFLVLE